MFYDCFKISFSCTVNILCDEIMNELKYVEPIQSTVKLFYRLYELKGNLHTNK